MQNRWLIVVASVLALIVGGGSILIFAFNVFVEPVTAELGIGRGVFGSALAASSTLTALGAVVVGTLMDRYSPRAVMLPGILLFAVGTAAFALMTPSVVGITAIFCFAGFFAGAQTPVPYSLVISRWFDANRGLALGLAVAGVGLGVVLVPQLANKLMGLYGWRGAYIGLAVAVIILAFIPVALVMRNPSTYLMGAAAKDNPTLPGPAAGVVFKSGLFWVLTFAFFITVIAINGTTTHIVPMLTGRGFAREAAIGMLSAIGIALILGRIFSGWCLDRFWGPYVAAVFLVLPAIGIAILAAGLEAGIPQLALLATVLCGLGIGAELDMMAFLTSRYFGLRAYGKIYGLMFGIFSIGTGLGPAFSGIAFDRAHSYNTILWVYVALLVVATVLIVRLGPYPYPQAKSTAARAPMPAAA